ncbi:MAG TPA: peptidoglycan DD-metalloendopeptidase family protein [Candidatus Dormibacteraeota bacterium]
MRISTAIAVAFGMLGLAAQPAAADTNSDLAAAQQRAALIMQVRAQLGTNLADALAAQDQLTRSLQDNEQQQQVTQGKIDAANAKIADLDVEINRLNAEITRTDHKIEVERAQLKGLARAIYVQPGSLLVTLAESKDLSDMISRISDLNSASARARDLKSQLIQDETREVTDRSKQQAARDEQVGLRDQAAGNLASLQNLQQQEEESKAKLDQKIAETRAELVLIQNQSVQLAEQITQLLQDQQDAIIATAMSQVWDQVKIYEGQNPLGTFGTSAGHSKTYRFVWPMPGATVTQGFGPTPYWFEPAFGGFAHFHTGIDTALPEGTPVQAADDGVVILVGSGPYGYGNYVVLEHQGGLTTLYGHLDRALVKVGDSVTQSEPIGLEGSTGNSTGAHLHFELRINNQPVDPSPYLPPGPPSAFKG